jgi:hypothetical protein
MVLIDRESPAAQTLDSFSAQSADKDTEKIAEHRIAGEQAHGAS